MRKNKKLKKLLKFIFPIISITFFGFILVWALLSAHEIRIQDVRSPQIVQNGGIRINNYIDNNDLTIFIDDIEHKHSNGIITNIPPGEHTVTLTLPEFYSWTTQIVIDEGLIKDLYPLLFPLGDLELTNITKSNVDKFFFSTYDDYIYYVVTKSTKGSDNGIFKLALHTPRNFFSNEEPTPIKISNIVPAFEEILQSNSYSLDISPDNRRILLKSQNNKTFIIDSQNPLLSPDVLQIENVEDHLGFSPDFVSWGENSAYLLFRKDNLLATHNLESQKQEIVFFTPESKPIFTQNRYGIFYVYQNKLFKFVDSLKSQIQLENMTLPNNIQNIISVPHSDENLILETDIETFYINLKESFLEKIDDNIEIVDISKNAQNILYRKDEQIISYHLEKAPITEEFMSEKNIILNTPITQETSFEWSDSSTHILKLDTENLTIMDFDGTNQINIFSSSSITPLKAYMPQNNSEIFFRMKDSQALQTQNVSHNIYSIDITE